MPVWLLKRAKLARVENVSIFAAPNAAWELTDAFPISGTRHLPTMCAIFVVYDQPQPQRWQKDESSKAVTVDSARMLAIGCLSEE